MRLLNKIFHLLSASFNSKTVVFLIVIIVLVRSLDLGYWKNHDKIISWDVISYYAYLPATFIYHDPKLEFLKNPNKDFSKKFWPVSSPTGKPVIMTTMGMSILYAPFFFFARGYSFLTNNKSDGFSEPYQFFLILSCIFYLAIGLIYLRKLLNSFFTDIITRILLVIIVFGTNLWYYATIEPTMTHAYLFALITIFTYYVNKWYKKPGYESSLILGFLGGLISLIRPSDIIIVIIFIFWGIGSFADLRSKLYLFLKKYYLIFLIMIIAFIVWIPQMLYWKMQSGQYLFYSYINNERFFFGNPQIINALFSYRNGWLIYSPVMVFALFGMVFLWKSKRRLFWTFTLYLIFHLYIISSWWCWWWGGSFGNRSMVDTYGILALSLGFFIQAIRKSRRFIKIPVFIVIYILVGLSIFNTMQAKRSIIHYDSMTKKAYWSVFLRYRLPKGYYKMLECPDYDKAREGIQQTTKPK